MNTRLEYAVEYAAGYADEYAANFTQVVRREGARLRVCHIMIAPRAVNLAWAAQLFTNHGL